MIAAQISSDAIAGPSPVPGRDTHPMNKAKLADRGTGLAPQGKALAGEALAGEDTTARAGQGRGRPVALDGVDKECVELRKILSRLSGPTGFTMKPCDEEYYRIVNDAYHILLHRLAIRETKLEDQGSTLFSDEVAKNSEILQTLTLGFLDHYVYAVSSVFLDTINCDAQLRGTNTRHSFDSLLRFTLCRRDF